MQKKRLDYKDKVNFKIHDVTTMKFGHLIEYDTTNIFVEKPYTKCAGETIPRPLSKKSKLNISLDQYCKVLNSLFLWYANLRAIKI